MRPLLLGYLILFWCFQLVIFDKILRVNNGASDFQEFPVGVSTCTRYERQPNLHFTMHVFSLLSLFLFLFLFPLLHNPIDNRACPIGKQRIDPVETPPLNQLGPSIHPTSVTALNPLNK